MNTEPEDKFLAEMAEIKKQKFIKFVAQLAALRDLQYENDMAAGIVKHAETIVALNLPSNLMRAAAILVDYFHGFPPDKRSFGVPEWVLARKLLPPDQRGLLGCNGFLDVSDLAERDVVVLIADLPEHGLHAGMAGIVRELLEEEMAEQNYQIEFGEPEDCNSHIIEVAASLLRRPRPGDLLENYRS